MADKECAQVDVRKLTSKIRQVGLAALGKIGLQIDEPYRVGIYEFLLSQRLGATLISS